MPIPFKGPLYYSMQRAHNPPFGLPSISPRDSHEHISELYYFEGLKCRSLSSLT